jgi:hypothetical protein
MIEDYLDQLKNPIIRDGVPQTGTALWEITKLVEAGLEFPEDEIPFIESLYKKGHYEQKWMANELLELLGH